MARKISFPRETSCIEDVAQILEPWRDDDDDDDDDGFSKGS